MIIGTSWREINVNRTGYLTSFKQVSVSAINKKTINFQIGIQFYVNQNRLGRKFGCIDVDPQNQNIGHKFMGLKIDKDCYVKILSNF